MSESEEQNDDSQRSKTVIAGLQTLAHILGLRDNFLIDLFKDPDDWSFVIKAHALLESVLCTLLAMHVRKRELEAVLAEEVEMKARIEMTKALRITTTDDRKAMYALGKLRNRLVHNAKDTSFTFAEYFKNKDVKKSFSETFGHGWTDPIPETEPPMARLEYVAANPKLAIFQSVATVAMYVVREAASIQTDMALEGLRRTAAAPAEGESGPS